MQNCAGTFVRASVEAVTAAAAAAAAQMPEDFRVSITNPPGKDDTRSLRSRGCCSTRALKDKAQGKMMVEFLQWALTDGQKRAKELGYAPVPKSIVDMELKALEKIKM